MKGSLNPGQKITIEKLNLRNLAQGGPDESLETTAVQVQKTETIKECLFIFGNQFILRLGEYHMTLYQLVR